MTDRIECSAGRLQGRQGKRPGRGHVRKRRARLRTVVQLFNIRIDEIIANDDGK